MTDHNTPNTQGAPKQDTASQEQTSGRQPDLIGYSVKDRGQEKDAAWNRVGAAWLHRDGKGFDLQLDATPVDGRVTLRAQKREDFKAERRENKQPHDQSRKR